MEPSPPGPPRVVIIDDHLLFRQGLRAILTTYGGIDVVQEAAAIEALEPPLEVLRPDVAVIDVMLRKSCGVASVRDVVRRVRSCRVLVLTAHADDLLLAESFAAGASGLALKDQDSAEVITAVRAVASGGRYIAPTLGGRPVAVAARVVSGHTSVRRLSAREREIFDLIVEGLSNRDLAERLHISIKTVEAHRVNINRKLDAHSTADLVRLAARYGLMIHTGQPPSALSDPGRRAAGDDAA